MLMQLPLRLRIFLFFGLMAAGAVALALGSLIFAWSRVEPALPFAPFATAFFLFAFMNVGFLLVIWFLFDEHVAQPIDMLSTNMRLRAHAGVETEIGKETARYLGDLAPAARAVSQAMDASLEVIRSNVSQETVQLRKERQRLTALLSEIPIATILVNAMGEIVLYDTQAAYILAQIAPPRLKAPLAEYFDPSAIENAKARPSSGSNNTSFALPDIQHRTTFNARLKPLGDDGDMIFIDLERDQLDADNARPLVFDFGLLESRAAADLQNTALADLPLVVFDTETTGLSVKDDAIVQIAAVRILNGRIVDGEHVDAFVNPGRAIPPASTRIHGVTDADVAEAPDIVQVGRDFHRFARDAVLVAHNAPFDIGLLREQEQCIGAKWDHPVLDTVLLSAVVFGTTADHSLDALCERLSIQIPTDLRHTALGDTIATAEAVLKLLPMLHGKGITTFGDLMQDTRRHSRLLNDLNED
ncbi:MAG: 3'-5' exonuclease [Cognatishimia sp.]|uniref:3'-5' exonuclease n=1 Tax=Cognatishimia sp. TaxID=2211648 RepID=UPI003B8CD343